MLINLYRKLPYQDAKDFAFPTRIRFRIDLKERRHFLIFMKPLGYYIQLGFSKSLKRLIYRLRSLYFTRSLLFIAVDLSTLQGDVEESYSFIIANIDDIQNEQNYDNHFFSKEQSIHRIKEGKQLFIHKKNSKIVCFQWLEPQKATIYAFDLNMCLPQDIAYDTGLYTLPEFRNKRLTYNFKKEILLYLKKMKYKKVFCVIELFNSNSLHIHKKLGYVEYQTVHYKKYWPIKYFCVEKYKSNKQKRFIAVSKTPEEIWKVFL